MRCLQKNSKKWAVTRILGLFLTVAATPLMMPAFFTQAIASDSDSDSDVGSDSDSDTGGRIAKKFTEEQISQSIIDTFETATNQNETLTHKPIILGTKKGQSSYHTGDALLNIVNNFINRTPEDFQRFEAMRANFTSDEANISEAEQYFAWNIITQYMAALAPVKTLEFDAEKKNKRIYRKTIADHYAGLLNFFDVGTHMLAYKAIVDAIEKDKNEKLALSESQKKKALEELSLKHERRISRKQQALDKFKDTGNGLKGASLKAFNNSVTEKEADIKALINEKEKALTQERAIFEATEQEISNDFQLIPATFQDAFRYFGQAQWTTKGVFAVAVSSVRSKRERTINYAVIEQNITPEILLSAQNRILSQILKAPTTLFTTTTVDQEETTKKSSKKKTSSHKKIQQRMVDLLKDEGTEEAQKLYTLFYFLKVKPARLEELATTVALEIQKELLNQQSEQEQRLKKVVKKEKSTSTSPSSGALSKLKKKKPASAEDDATSTSTSTEATADTDEEDDATESKAKAAAVKDDSATSTSTSTEAAADTGVQNDSATSTSTPEVTSAASGTTLGGSTPTTSTKKKKRT